MFVQRRLNLPDLLKRKSFFLFGPRASGKSTLIAQQFRDQATVIDLLDAEMLLRASADPVGVLAMAVGDGRGPVVIDAIQRAPLLLNEVHRLIESRGLRFLLTGSSLVKLRRGGVNLLAGRAWLAHLYPLTSDEITDFDLPRYLQYGGLPGVYTSDNPDEELRAYLTVYLQEELRAEGLIRNLPPFARFLQTMGLVSGEVINFANIGNDCQVPATTIREYVRILEDSLMGVVVEAWRKSQRRKATTTAKFYLFDTGVSRMLSGTKTIERHSDRFGKAFAQFIWMELRAYLAYTRKHYPLNFWRTQKGTHEVDFIVDDAVAIEVVASRKTSNRDSKNLQALAEEGIVKKFYLVSCDPVNRKHGDMVAMFWQDFLRELWHGKVVL